MIITLKDFSADVKGSIDVRLPTNGERIKLFKKANVDFFDLQETLSSVGDDEKASIKLMTDIVVEILDEVGPFCEKINIKIKDGDKEVPISSFDEISSRQNLLGVQMKIASTVLMGADAIANKKKKK